MKKDIEKEVIDDFKLVGMPKKLKKNFEKVAKRETGMGNKFNSHLREIMRKEILRSDKSNKIRLNKKRQNKGL